MRMNYYSVSLSVLRFVVDPTPCLASSSFIILQAITNVGLDVGRFSLLCIICLVSFFFHFSLSFALLFDPLTRVGGEGE